MLSVPRLKEILSGQIRSAPGKIRSASANTRTFLTEHRTKLSVILRAVFSAGLLLLSVGTLLRFILGPSEGFYTSDCTDTLWWANASFESGRLISDTFSYAAILPFGGNLLMLPFLPLFGVSMTAQKLGMTLFLLLFAGAVLFLCRSMRLSWISSSLTFFVTSLVLSSSDKLLEIMWEHIIYYSLGILFFCVGLGLLFRADAAVREGRHRPAIVFASLLFVFTLLSATNGLQSLVTWIAPALFGIVMVWVLEEKQEGFRKNTLRFGASIALIGVATLLGLGLLQILSHGVSAGYADAYSNYDGINNWMDNLHDVPIQWFRLLGINTVAGEPLASLDSVGTMIRLFTAILLPVIPLVGILCYRRIENRYVRMTLFAHLGVSMFILFACICGQLVGANWRLVPMLGSSLLATSALLFDRIRFSLPPVRRLSALLLIVPCLFACVTFRDLWKLPLDYGQDNEIHTVAQTLEDRGLTKGYATFWHSELVTLISDSAVCVRNIQLQKVDSTTTPCVRAYQSDSRWYDDIGEEKTFLLLSDSEYNSIYRWRTQQEDRILEEFKIGGYTVVVFTGGVPLG